MNTELVYSDAMKLAELIRTREVSPVEVIKAHLDRIEAVNPRVNAIVMIAVALCILPKKQKRRYYGEMNWVSCTVCHSR
jgi:Asp-tRNA(Asn)/Glu-tRNA(Gln) amidotransferase A subunit family amidase